MAVRTSTGLLLLAAPTDIRLLYPCYVVSSVRMQRTSPSKLALLKRQSISAVFQPRPLQEAGGGLKTWLLRAAPEGSRTIVEWLKDSSSSASQIIIYSANMHNATSSRTKATYGSVLAAAKQKPFSVPTCPFDAGAETVFVDYEQQTFRHCQQPGRLPHLRRGMK